MSDSSWPLWKAVLFCLLPHPSLLPKAADEPPKQRDVYRYDWDHGFWSWRSVGGYARADVGSPIVLVGKTYDFPHRIRPQPHRGRHQVGHALIARTPHKRASS